MTGLSVRLAGTAEIAASPQRLPELAGARTSTPSGCADLTQSSPCLPGSVRRFRQPHSRARRRCCLPLYCQMSASPLSRHRRGSSTRSEPAKSDAMSASTRCDMRRNRATARMLSRRDVRTNAVARGQGCAQTGGSTTDSVHGTIGRPTGRVRRWHAVASPKRSSREAAHGSQRCCSTVTQCAVRISNQKKSGLPDT
jgi:hypothetical protein